MVIRFLKNFVDLNKYHDILNFLIILFCFFGLIFFSVTCKNEKNLKKPVSLDLAKSAANYFSQEMWGPSQLLFIRLLTDSFDVPQAYLAVFQIGEGKIDSIEKITREVEKILESGNVNEAYITDRFGILFVGGRYGVNPFIAGRKGLPYSIVRLKEATNLVCSDSQRKIKVNRWLYLNLTEIAEFIVNSDSIYVDLMRMKTLSKNNLREIYLRQSNGTKKAAKKWEKLISILYQ